MSRQIAVGGMGVVCEAVHEGTGRRVALKIIRDMAALGEDKVAWLTRFAREARAVGALDSPHIIQVFDAGTDDATGQPFIAMELLAGSDLSRLLKQLGPLPPTVALKIVAQACLALERAHEAGVIHRDIKPGNVFLAESHHGAITVKLVDFGIAKVISEEITGPEHAELTQTGSLLGTPTYMSPEQAKGMRTIDHRADLWALAVVLYKALSNRVPHPKLEGLGQLIVAICTEPVTSVQYHAPWVPPEVAAILDRALQLEIDRRFQTAAEFRAAIEEVLEGNVRLTRGEVRGLTDEERALIARRHASVFPPSLKPRSPFDRRSDGGAEESRTQPGVVQVADISTARPHRMRWLAAGFAGIAAIGVAMAWTQIHRKVATASPIEPAARAGDPPPKTEAPPRTVQVDITPANATVEVDGKPTEVTGGKVAIEGQLGTTHRVKLSVDGREVTTQVAITQNGAMPAKVALEPAPAPPVRVGAQRPELSSRKPPAPTEAPKPTSKETPKPPPAKGVGVISDFE